MEYPVLKMKAEITNSKSENSYFDIRTSYLA